MELDNNPQQQPTIPTVKVSHKKRWLLLGGAFVALILCSILVWVLFHRSDTPKNNSTSTSQSVTVTHVCSPELIGEANAPLAASDQTSLATVVDKITALKDYDRDPNCLYIVLIYNIATGDAVASQDYMNKFDLVYNSGVGLSGAFTVSTVPIGTLKKNVDFLSQNASQNATNAKLGNESDAKGSDAADKFQQEHK